MSTVISVENVGKQYRLGEVGTGTLSHDLNRWWHKVRGKEDPYLKIGERNDRSTKGDSQYAWALRDVSFSVQQGEVLGIIGKNGAGKSTLLKVLSRVTTPTTGEIKVKGRIASLLEVGTGFHPELTGRENIYLNGAILGMRHHEIAAKFDEIVDFSGCERYVDTPVKRYSSGMYVRLAFAVAAHLEPEILIVDEVLAVGDAEFQKKCLGKMKDVAGQGRTVLFVSHNMAAVSSLCTRGILMESSQVALTGGVSEVVSRYLKSSEGGSDVVEWLDPSTAPGNSSIRVLRVSVLNPDKKGPITVDSGAAIEIRLLNSLENLNLDCNIYLSTDDGSVLMESSCDLSTQNDSRPGHYVVSGTISPRLLNVGQFNLTVFFGLDQRVLICKIEQIVHFEVHGQGQIGRGSMYPAIGWQSRYEGCDSGG